MRDGFQPLDSNLASSSQDKVLRFRIILNRSITDTIAGKNYYPRPPLHSGLQLHLLENPRKQVTDTRCDRAAITPEQNTKETQVLQKASRCRCFFSLLQQEQEQERDTAARRSMTAFHL